MKSVLRVRLSLVICAVLLFSGMLRAQEDPHKFLMDNYPKLSSMFEKELKEYPVHYVFAIDVSGTMDQYAPQVQPALKAFVNALSDGDKITIIRFGTEAKDNDLGYSGTINSQLKADICRNIDKLYDKSQNLDIRSRTDIKKAMEAIAKVISLNPNYKMNIVISLTDFVHDDGTNHRFSDAELEDMSDKLAHANMNKAQRNIALKLPVDPRYKAGYCLDQLQEKVFPTEGSEKLQLVEFTNPNMISNYFSMMIKEVMVDKLRAIVENENKINGVEFDQDINMDGDVTANVKWKPSRLYPKLAIDSSKVADPNKSGFYFDVEEDALGEKKEHELELELGQLKHHGFGIFGFHYMSDSLQLGIDLPTDYDDELTKLNVKKPLAKPCQKVDKLIFTAPIPFKLACLIALAILIYIILVIRQVKINASNEGCFKGKIEVFNSKSKQLGETYETGAYQKSVSIGASCKVDVPVDWNITIGKETYSPFKLKNPLLVIKDIKAAGGRITKSNNKKAVKGDAIKKGKYILNCYTSDSEDPDETVEFFVR